MKSFESSFSEDGIEIRLTETKQKILRKTRSNARVKDWVSSGDPEILRGLAALGSRIEIAAAEDEEYVSLSHEQGAQLSNLQAKALGLPPSIPFQLRIWSSGSWVDDSYTLNSEFLDRGQPLYLDERVGCFARVGRVLYRIPHEIFSLVELVKAFPIVRDDKIACLAEIGQKIGDPSLADGAVLADEQIANIKIRHVSGFSASVSGSLEDPKFLRLFSLVVALNRQSHLAAFLTKRSKFLVRDRPVRLSLNFSNRKTPSRLTFFRRANTFLSTLRSAQRFQLFEGCVPQMLRVDVPFSSRRRRSSRV